MTQARLKFGPLDARCWDRLVTESPQGSPFNRSDFMACLGTTVCYWGVTDGLTVLAAASVQTSDGVRALAPDESFNFYQGILIAPTLWSLAAHARPASLLAALDVLLDGMAKRHDALWLCFHPELSDLRAVQWFNYNRPEAGLFDIRLRYTGVLALPPSGRIDDILALASHGRRSDYRKAISRQVAVEESHDVGLLDDLHRRTFARQGTARGIFENQLCAMAKAALTGGYGEMLVARLPDGRVASATLFLWDRNTAYYLFGANDPELRDTGSGTLLMTANLARAAQRGNRSVDMVGVNSPQRGGFKTSLGAEPIPFFEASWAQPGPVAAAK